MSEIVKEDGCWNCRYTDMDITDYPCVECRNNIPKGMPSYEHTPCLWCSQDTAENNTVENNSVNHPSHYNQGGIECIDAMLAAYGTEAVENFCICNAFKYIWRSKHKNGVQDIDKAIWYLTKYTELLEVD